MDPQLEEETSPKRRGRKPSVLGRLAGDFERAKDRYDAAVERRAKAGHDRLDAAVAEAKRVMDEAELSFANAWNKLKGDN